jgi:transcriptional regulator with XRE-family HTH domain
MYYDRINELCNRNGIKISPLLTKLGLSTGNISRWRNGAIVNSDIICKIADYFNVSTDYLLGRTDNPEINK